MRRLAATCGIAAILLVTAASPADAHTVTGVQPTNFASHVLSITPPVPGLRIRLLDLGRRVELSNRSGEDVVVIGYYGEPYLRVGPYGAFENSASKTLADNRPPVGTTTTRPRQPSDANPTPSWRHIATAPVVRWRDQRTRYEGPAVGGSAKRVVSSWAIDLRRADAPVRVTGLITYLPGPAPIPWVLVTVALAGLTVAAAWSSDWGRWLSVALAVLLASDAIYSFGTAAATHDPLISQLARVLLVGLVSTVAWIVGVAAIPSLQRNHEGGLVAAGGVGLVIAAFSGATDVQAFARSQVATVFPAVTARIAVALAIGLGMGLVLAAIAVIARDPALRPTVAASTDGNGR